jgi:hypothetical protein
MDFNFSPNVASQNFRFNSFSPIPSFTYCGLFIYAAPHIYIKVIYVFLFFVDLSYYISNLLDQETQQLESGQFQMVHVVPACNHPLLVFMF